MSQDNVEMVRAVYAHFNATGEPPWELFDPDAEFDATAVVGLGVVRGREKVLSSLRDYAAVFEEWQVEPEEFFESGNQVVTTVRDGGRLKDTGDEIYNRFTHVWTFRSGKILHWKTFTDREEALQAVGLRKEDLKPAE